MTEPQRPEGAPELPAPLDPDVQHSAEAIRNEGVRRLTLRAEKIMRENPDEFELIQDFEEMIEDLLSRDFLDLEDNRSGVEVLAGLMGLEVHFDTPGKS